MAFFSTICRSIGPNRLNSRRSMTVWEMEARRDRQYFKQVLESRGREALESPRCSPAWIIRPTVPRWMPGSRNPDVPPQPETSGRFRSRFLESPSAPVAAYDGMVRIADNEARSPRLFVRNTTSRPVRAVEMGWVVKDERGREFVAGSIPVDVPLAPAAEDYARAGCDVQVHASRAASRSVSPI